MNGTIVCCVEATDASRLAIEAAAQISERLDLRLVLVHVIRVPARLAPSADDEIYWRDRQGALALLKELMNDARIAHRAESRVLVGDVSGMIATVAAEEAADLIVIGASRTRRFQIRSRRRLAAQLAAASPVPVLVATSQHREGLVISPTQAASHA